MWVDLDAHRGSDAPCPAGSTDQPNRSARAAARGGLNSARPRLEECAPILYRQNAREISVSHRRCPVSLGTISGASTAATTMASANVPSHSSISSSVRIVPDSTNRPASSTTAMPVLALGPHARSMPTKLGKNVVTDRSLSGCLTLSLEHVAEASGRVRRRVARYDQLCG